MGLRGRLGNNLWQYAAGLAMARAIDAELLFDGHRVPEDAHLLPELLGPNYREVTPAQLRRVGVATFGDGTAPTVARFALRHGHELGRRLRGKGPGQVVRGDLTDRYRPELFALEPPVYLTGYFQDLAFLAGIEDELTASLRWPDDVSLPAGLTNTVGVSFRRGDFNLYDAALPLDYYDRAMRIVADEVAEPTFVLFGDDPEFVELFAERARHGRLRGRVGAWSSGARRSSSSGSSPRATTPSSRTPRSRGGVRGWAIVAPAGNAWSWDRPPGTAGHESSSGARSTSSPRTVR